MYQAKTHESAPFEDIGETLEPGEILGVSVKLLCETVKFGAKLSGEQSESVY